MNVIVADRKIDELSTLDIDLIKSIKGVYPVEELKAMFKDFFFNKMILDLTAIKEYSNINNIEELVKSIDPNKIIFYLPEDPVITSKEFLSKLIDLGIYNFTAKLEGVKYLLGHTNTYDDVAYINNVETTKVDNNSNNDTKIIGLKNLTDHSGVTTLIYMLHKACRDLNLNSYALEVGKNDFQFFNDAYMISTDRDNVNKELQKLKGADVIFVDLNALPNDSICNDVLYILESSILKLNKLVLRDKRVFERLKKNKVILNNNLLDEDKIHDLEYETKIRFYHCLPPMNEREKNSSISELLQKLNITTTGEIEEEKKETNNKFFSLFKKD